MSGGERLFESTIDLRTGVITIRPHVSGQEAPESAVSGQSSERAQVIQPERRVRQGMKDKLFPEGAVESLRPLIAETFKLYGIEQDSGYWTQLEQDMQMTPSDACRQLDTRGISPLSAARAVMNSDPQFKMSEAFGNAPKEYKQFALGKLAWQILSYYPDASQAKWAQELSHPERVR